MSREFFKRAIVPGEHEEWLELWFVSPEVPHLYVGFSLSIESCKLYANLLVEKKPPLPSILIKHMKRSDGKSVCVEKARGIFTYTIENRIERKQRECMISVTGTGPALLGKRRSKGGER